jgi:hypothetical protein
MLKPKVKHCLNYKLVSVKVLIEFDVQVPEGLNDLDMKRKALIWGACLSNFPAKFTLHMKSSVPAPHPAAGHN